MWLKFIMLFFVTNMTVCRIYSSLPFSFLSPFSWVLLSFSTRRTTVCVSPCHCLPQLFFFLLLFSVTLFILTLIVPSFHLKRQTVQSSVWGDMVSNERMRKEKSPSTNSPLRRELGFVSLLPPKQKSKISGSGPWPYCLLICPAFLERTGWTWNVILLSLLCSLEYSQRPW